MTPTEGSGHDPQTLREKVEGVIDWALAEPNCRCFPNSDGTGRNSIRCSIHSGEATVLASPDPVPMEEGGGEVTVRLTREEAEHLLAPEVLNAAQFMRQPNRCKPCVRIIDKLRAALSDPKHKGEVDTKQVSKDHSGEQQGARACEKCDRIVTDPTGCWSLDCPLRESVQKNMRNRTRSVWGQDAIDDLAEAVNALTEAAHWKARAEEAEKALGEIRDWAWRTIERHASSPMYVSDDKPPLYGPVEAAKNVLALLPPTEGAGSTTSDPTTTRGKG